MSSSKGNVSRTRRQKYQNRTVFKNDLHDTSGKTKFINTIQPCGVCPRCTEIIQWKIKYKKYKPLTATKKCVKCEQKTVKHAYHIMCMPCSRKEGICSKCSVKLDDSSREESGEGENLDQIIKALPERKRRTLLRYLNKQNEMKKNKNREEKNGKIEKVGNQKEDEENDKIKDDILADKINKLKLDAMNKDVEDYNSDDLGSEFDSEAFSDEEDDDDDDAIITNNIYSTLT